MLNKYERYKKVFRGALKLQRPLFLQSMLVADCVALQILPFLSNSFNFTIPQGEVLQAAWRPWGSFSFQPCGW